MCVSLKHFRCHRSITIFLKCQRLLCTENLVCEKDTVLNYLWKCVHIQMFWQYFEKKTNWNESIYCDRLSINTILTLFSKGEKNASDECFNFSLLNAKIYLYKCRLDNIKPWMDMFSKDYTYCLTLTNMYILLKWH